MPQGQTINQSIYSNMLQRLMRSIQEKRIVEDQVMAAPSPQCSCSSTLSILEFLAKNNIAALEQPPYSPDLAPVTFFFSLNSRNTEINPVSGLNHH